MNSADISKIEIFFILSSLSIYISVYKVSIINYSSETRRNKARVTNARLQGVRWNVARTASARLLEGENKKSTPEGG